MGRDNVREREWECEREALPLALPLRREPDGAKLCALTPSHEPYMRLLPLLFLTLCCAHTRASLQDKELRLRDHADLSTSLESLARANPGLVTLETVARSREGREVTVARIQGGGEGARPGILVVANVEGPRVFGSALALDHAWRLAEGYATDEAVRSFLDSTVVYVLPRANPDAADARFARPLVERHASGHGVDDDRDGREGEDPPRDVNGDGLVTQMRVLDPEGEWMEDPSDPRVLVEADRAKGERGKWKLYTEGRDLDDDERVAEDAPLDARVDRNFPAGWEPHQAEYGLFPTDEPEVQGIVELLLAHPEIVMVVHYGAADDLVEAPKGIEDDARPVKRVPPSGVRESDVAYLKELGERYREATESDAKGESVTSAGTFARWCYEHRGLWVLSASLWEMPLEAPAKEEEPEEVEDPEAEAPKEGGRESSKERKKKGDKEPEPSDDAKRLTWVDAVEPSRFVDWTPFEHPELGAVEIGGFAPYARLEPPADAWEELAGDHLDFLLSLGGTLPRIAFAGCTRERLGEGVWRVEAVLENSGLLPLLSRSMRDTRTTRPGKLTIELPEGAMLLGGAVQTLVDELDGSGGRHEESWLVLGPDDLAGRVRVRFDSDHAGTLEATPEVKP